jgi:hypothetical protein
MKKNILLLAVLFAFVGKTFAQTTYDLFTYTEPIGYKKETAKDYISYTKTDAKTGTYCIISLYAQTQSSGDIKKDFETDWQDLVVKPLQVKDAPKADNSDDISGWKTYSGGSNFEFGGGTSMVLLTTAKKENSNAAILIVTNAKDVIASEVDPFFVQLKLGKPNNFSIKTNTTPITPKLAKNQPPTKNPTTTSNKANEAYNTDGGGISGVWVAYAFGITSKRLEFKTKVFFSSGKYIYDMPIEGLDNISEATEGMGTYKTDKDVIYYKNGNWEGSSSFKKESNNKITLEASDYYYKSANPNGKMLQGTYILYNVDIEKWQTLPKGNRQVIHFNKNGTFEDEGVFKFAFDHLHSDFDLPGKGTYYIKNYTLYLKYDDGRGNRKPQSIYSWAASNLPFEQAKTIFIGGFDLTKVK